MWQVEQVEVVRSVEATKSTKFWFIWIMFASYDQKCYNFGAKLTLNDPCLIVTQHIRRQVFVLTLTFAWGLIYVRKTMRRRLWFCATYPWTRPLFCSCWSRMFSSFRGLGMKPISQPSFTNRPIHQSLLNFWRCKREKGSDQIEFCIITYMP